MWQAQVWVKWNKNAPVTNDWTWMKDWKEVHGAWSVMGDWDMLIAIDAKTPGEVEEFIWKKLRAKDWVGQHALHLGETGVGQSGLALEADGVESSPRSLLLPHTFGIKGPLEAGGPFDCC